jgi:2-polyprenyl-3-methyl-5-hydroxy-6-metoxy-1,4-benzoquinol methylase
MEEKMPLAPIPECRVCGGKDLHTVFKLEDQYVATIFIKCPEEAARHERYPLELVICGQNESDGCGFVQLLHTVPRNILFEHYWYRSGINQTMRDALADIVNRVREYTDLHPGDAVCDAGCNDGTLLSFYPEHIKRIGIDPAANMAEFSRPHADAIVSDYFSAEAYFSATKQKAKVVTSVAMFYSVIDPVNFARDVSKILADDGVWVLQMSSLQLMLRNNCYDNIVHEHVGYYTLDVMERLLKQFGLHVVDCETNDINAGSVRLYIKRTNFKSSPRVNELRGSELRGEYRSLETFKRFALDSRTQTEKLRAFLDSNDAERTCFYGASTKGNVILQHSRSGPGDAFGVAERNPKKFGYYTLGSGLPIISEEEMRRRKPANVIVLPYHFRDEIVKRECALLEEGTRLVFPLPQFEIFAR